MEVVIDTNTLIRMASHGLDAPLFDAWHKRQSDVVFSKEIIAELEDVLNRPTIQRFIPRRRSQRFLAYIQKRALFVELAAEFPHCRDAKDDMVIATAVAAQASYLITADKDLYDDPDLLHAMRQLGTRIVPPAEFLRRARGD